MEAFQLTIPQNCICHTHSRYGHAVFWDQHVVMMKEFLAKGTTITGTYSASLLLKLQEVLRTKRYRMLTKGVHLLQDNAHVRNSHIAQMEVRSCS